MNVALNKRIVEQSVNRPQAATDGNSTAYTGFEGFAHFDWPGYCTLDLDETYELKCIRFLLWDGLGKGGSVPAPRAYQYRLLTSTDLQNWTVQYETNMDGSIGWQVFDFLTPLSTRYIRIHGLRNTAKPDIHIVEIEAHTENPPELPRAPKTLVRFDEPVNAHEVQTSLQTAGTIESIITSLREVVDKNRNIINTEGIQGAIGDLEMRLGDVRRVEANIDSIKRLIVLPVAQELHYGRKAGMFSILGFWVGLVGIVVSVVLFAISLLKK